MLCTWGVNRAAHLANEAGRNGRAPIIVGGVFQQNLNEHYQKLLTRQAFSNIGTVYTGNAIRTDMNEGVDNL